MSQKFSLIEDELLVDKLREFPCIFDHENKDFKDHQIRENVWNQIGRELSKKPEDCKMRWKNIRDNYLKQKRKQKQGTGSAASTKKTSKWHLFEQLKFLEHIKSERSRIHNSNEKGNTESTRNSEESGDEDVATDSDLQPTIIEDDVRSPDSIDFNQPPPKRVKGTNMAAESRSNTPISRSSTRGTAKTKLLNQLEERDKDRIRVLSQLTNIKEEDEVDLFMRSIALMASSSMLNTSHHTQTQPHHSQTPTATFSLNTSHNTSPSYAGTSSTPDHITNTTSMNPYVNQDYYYMK